MPRFEDEHITCLKKAMLPRTPDCYFVPDDYPGIIKETGLNQAQIEKWADHLRSRLPVPQDRENFLRNTGGQEEVPVYPCLSHVKCILVKVPKLGYGKNSLLIDSNAF